MFGAGSLLALTGTHPMIAALAVDPSRQSTPVYLLPRSPEAEATGRDWSVPIEAPSQMWSMHVGNAFEERNARGGINIQLHMSGCSYQWFNFHRMFGKFRIHTYIFEILLIKQCCSPCTSLKFFDLLPAQVTIGRTRSWTRPS